MALNINLSNAYNDQRIFNNIKSGDIGVFENISAKTEITGEANLKDLLIGDVFSGEILDITNHDVQILLGESGEKLSATMQQALELNIGDKLLFQVKEKNDNRLVIRPVANNEVSMDLVNKSLSAAGFSATDKNIAIVKELIAGGQPIDRSSILNLIKLTSEFGNENIDKLVNMTKNGIEINSENLEQYDKYMNSNHQLTEGISEIATEVGEIISKDIYSGGIIEGLENMKDLFTGLAFAVGENNEVTESLVREDVDNEIEKTVTNQENAAGSSVNINKEAAQISESNAEIRTKAPENKVINSENSEHIGYMEKAGEMLDKADTFTKLSEAVKDIIKHNIDEKEVLELLKPEKIAGKVKRIFEKELFVDVKELEENNNNIKEELNRIYEKLDKIADSIKDSNIGAKNESIADAARNIKNNLTFLNELNNIEAFVQIPIKLSSGEANGELYVFNRKRKKPQNDNMLTAFLHLDLEHLGVTEVNITMENYTSENPAVTTKFTLADEAGMKIVEEHLGELTERLRKLGYRVNVSVEANEEENKSFNSLMPITSNNDEAVNIKRYTLDIRT